MARNFIAIALFTLAAALMWAAWYQAKHQTVRIESNTQGELAERTMDRTTTFGRVVLDENGKVIKWNAGARLMTGYTYDDMVGQTIESLIPDEREHRSYILEGVTKEHTHDWWMEAPDGVTIQKKDGTLSKIRVDVRDISDDTGRFRILYFDYPGRMTPLNVDGDEQPPEKK